MKIIKSVPGILIQKKVVYEFRIYIFLYRKIYNVSDNQHLYAKEPQECNNPDCLCNIRHKSDDKKDSDGDNLNGQRLIKY